MEIKVYETDILMKDSIDENRFGIISNKAIQNFLT